MALAGFHNVSMFDSSFLRESQSSESRQCGEQNRPSTRASSILQMWRELEGEHVVNHHNVRFGERIQRQRSDRSNTDSVSTFLSDGPESVGGNDSLEASDVQNECGTCLESHVRSQNEHDDGNSLGSEQSADLGEVERERVRQIFHEWMNSGANSHSSNGSHINSHSRAEWLGENERERVRIIMEWVQVNCQQKGNCDSPTDEGASEIGPQIKLVRDGLHVNHGEICERKAIRRLCGRQALLDLLTRAQSERKREIQELLDHRPVSSFTHRNRIQSLLRGRFLRNGSTIQDERLTCRAASELGMLRQRNTVSDLREGFLSRLDNSVHSSNNSQSDDSSSNEDHNSYRNGQLESDEEQEVLEDMYDLFEPSDEESGRNDFPVVGNLDFGIIGNINQQLSVIQAAEGQGLFSNVDYMREQGRVNDVSGNWRANALLQETSEMESIVQGHLGDGHEVFQEQDAPSNEASDQHEVGDQVEGMQVNIAERFNWQETSPEVEEGQGIALDHEEIEWQQSTILEANEWADNNEEGLTGSWQENIANQWDHRTPDNDFGEHHHTQEPHEDWHDDGLQEAIDSWLDVPSGQEVGGAIGRVDAFYFPEDDNVYSMELRELLSRRRVSSLLRSGFRASLDQLIQSYVERQVNASNDWEADEPLSSPTFIEQDREQQNDDQVQDGDASGGADRISQSDTASQPHWEQDLHRLHWSQNSPHHQLGNQEWEIINELRIDMVRLQQRMNNMQRMLEACMDMQLELQRSVRQEVSAALNRSAVSTDACNDDPPKDDSKWDFVKKGICCICCEHNIDSLLYRCGHMCTCSRCAEKLVQGKDKCPMCRAPVIEAVRAYSVQE
ncbi:hypothetical protein ACH5RR_021044 [Cinchona calisaya]|uniref:RING-type domain-containing protein n=1 Tax=Cinchona calisaya TaxID=153742 RepID=A0ABD2ZJG1_9GENT